MKTKLFAMFLCTFLFVGSMSVSALSNNNSMENLEEALLDIGITIRYGDDHSARYLDEGFLVGPHIGVSSDEESPKITSVDDVQLILDVMKMFFEYDVPAIGMDRAIVDIIRNNEEFRAYFNAGRAEFMSEKRKQGLRDIADSYTEEELIALFNLRPGLIREFEELGLLGDFFKSQSMLTNCSSLDTSSTKRYPSYEYVWRGYMA